ncbi:MAG: hypothetical protein KGJ72_13555 [Gammaproteobacteria bacterium]|nr:hypothetical protein [Gammaproteobacteria bacterium]
MLTSTNDPGTSQVLVYQLQTGVAPALSLVQTLPTGGRGGAGGNAGILQMRDDFGAVANYGSSTVSELVRAGDFMQVRGQIRLAPGCLKPDSVARAPAGLDPAHSAEERRQPPASRRLPGFSVPRQSTTAP